MPRILHVRLLNSDHDSPTFTFRSCVKSAARSLEFLRAVYMGAVTLSHSSLKVRSALSTAKTFLRTMSSLVTRKYLLHRGSFLWKRRMRICLRCPIYDKNLKTCGSRRQSSLSETEVMGCLCYMPLKSRFTNVTCWLN